MISVVISLLQLLQMALSLFQIPDLFAQSDLSWFLCSTTLYKMKLQRSQPDML